jgi:hypothetical protein
MTRLFLLFLFLLVPHAQGAELATPINAIAKLATTYANSLGCAVYIDKKNIIPFTLDYQDVFVVLYAIDDGCSGGSAMQRSVFAVVGRSNYGHRLYVLSRYSSPEQTSMDFPALTERIFVKDGQLRFSAKALSDHDALCCPSKRIEGQVLFLEGRWVDGNKNQ